MRKRLVFYCVALIMVLTLFAGCSKKPQDTLTVNDQLPVSVIQGDDVAQQTPDGTQTITGKTHKATLYYVDELGYTVPVSRTIPWEEGIAKATLKWLIGDDGDAILSAKGLKTPLPKGTTLDLDISDGKAKVDIKLPESGFESKEQEAAAIGALVNTLLEFPTVKSVSFLFNGQKLSKLPHGTVVEEVYTKKLVNSRGKAAPTTADGKVELYYTNTLGQVLVPVYQAMDSKTPQAAMAQLLDPGTSGLSSILPEGCKILSVSTASDGVVKVNLSKEFEALSDMPSMQTMALKAIMLTCKQFSGVQDVDVLVDGQPLEAGVATMAGLDGADINTYN